MAFDGIAVRCIASELEKKLLGGRTDKIYMPEKDEIVLTIRSLGKGFKLLLSCNPSLPRVHFIENMRENPQTPPSFCMLLRKHLSGGKIIRISQPDMERIIEIAVQCKNELGDTVEKRLIIEIMGRHSNIILTDENGRILECMRRIDASLSRVRLVLPGLPYEYPPSQEKLLPEALSYEEVRRIIFDCPNEKRLDRHILDSFAGFSPLMSREPVFKACGDCSPAYMEISATQAEDVAKEVFAMLENIANRQFSPCIIYDETGSPKDFSALPVTMYEKCKKTDFLCESLDSFYFTRDSRERIKRHGADLIKTVSNLLDRFNRKALLQQESVLESEKKDEYKMYADIIMANIYKMQKGDKRLFAENFYDGGEIEISLDATLSPAENAQKYYNLYNKLKNTAEKAAIALEQSKADIEYLESVQMAIENSQNLSDLAEIKAELADEGYVKQRQKNSKKEKQKQSIPFEFVSSDGFTILVGRNNRQNDYLTLKLAKKHDIWFHTKNIPGSHTVIITEKKEVPERTLLEAAGIAAYHSRAKASDNVPVDFTEIKFVKKPAGAKPGMVIYTDYNTVYTTPREGNTSQKDDTVEG